MSDYISRDAFIADCEGRYCAPCKEQGKDANGVRCHACWVDDMLSEVLDAPAADVEPVRRGIPCSEKMPNPGERVLATDGGFVGEMYIDKRGQWRRYNVTYIQNLMALDILWWLPMPEPPEKVLP